MLFTKEQWKPKFNTNYNMRGRYILSTKRIRIHLSEKLFALQTYYFCRNTQDDKHIYPAHKQRISYEKLKTTHET